MTAHPKKEAFLTALGTCGSVSQACETLELGRRTVYTWRKEDAEFAAGWDEAKELAGDALEDEGHKRAFAGSDTLLIFMLKGAKPEKYRERISTELTGKGGGPVELSELDRASRVAAIMARRGLGGTGLTLVGGTVGTATGTADASAGQPS